MADKPFPITVKAHSTDCELVDVEGPGFKLTLCTHGAQHLANLLNEVAKKSGQHCDGYRHGDDSTMLVGSEVTTRPRA
jgi:hypothetical protein